MTVRAELCSEIPSAVPKHIRILRRLLVAANRILDRFPGQKHRITQLAADGFTGLSTLFAAWLMHSDFSPSTKDLRAIWLYALLIFVGRPLSLMLVTRYRVPWHNVRVPDVAELALASIPASLLAFFCCVLARPSWAVVPSGVIAAEFPLFVGMAASMRCLRRLAYEEDDRSKIGSQVLVGSKNRVPATNLVSQVLPLAASNLPGPTTWNQESIDTYRDRVVLVTGAGGSIGGALCRKLCHLPISRLLLLDIDETATFELDRELNGLSTEHARILGDIRNREFLTRIFAQHRPHIVFHAAAYKHVSVMEANPSAAILNNVIGTRNVIDAAIEARCERFLFISTDKAVEPASIMGATKRIAELLVQSRAEAHPKIRFACVRFGNVLGSRGSVVPIFQKQIEKQQPLTITDRRMTRYFITQEQATDLALLACTLCEHGDIYVFDSGQPIKIVDLAHRIAASYGLNSPQQIDFEIIGIRPGEKLHEHLWEQDATLIPTRFAGIYALGSAKIPTDLEAAIAELGELAAEYQNVAIISKFRSLGIGYSPANTVES